MSDDVIRFRRDQLAQFLPTLELIKQFESLVMQATQTTPDAVVDIESILAGQLRSTNAANDRHGKQIREMQTVQPRQQDLHEIKRQIAEIRAFLGM